MGKEQKNSLWFNLQESFVNLFSDYVQSVKQLDSSDDVFFLFLAKPRELSEILNTLEKAETMSGKISPRYIIY